ncbi:MAG: hypothetical protein ACJASQ_001952 [Crocinitomicaceae bacterium]|jgi:hypothetical protein
MNLSKFQQQIELKKPNHNLSLPIGNVSLDEKLGKFYQDFTQALFHFDENYFGDFDAEGIPMSGFGEQAVYSQIYIVQYGLICHDLVIDGIDVELNKGYVKNCVNWLLKNKEEHQGTTIWRNHYPNPRYDLKSGWVSGMYQGQVISLLLRYGQMFDQMDVVLPITQSAFEFFDIEYKDGGVKRFDKNGLLWFEEYPGAEPSFVLNGFVYTLLGIYDLWRVTKDPAVKNVIDECVKTLKESMQFYDSGYWSVYDQLNKELATKYYHKNIHIPLMEVLHNLTGEEIFDAYKKRWEKQLNSNFNRVWVQVMYRVQPRLRRFSK